MAGQLSSREKVLSIAVGTVVFLLVNYFVVDYFMTNRTRLTTDLARQTGQLKMFEKSAAEKPKWEQREAWLAEKQPKIGSEDSAGVQLLDQVKEVAKTHSVVLNDPAIRVPARKPEYTSVSVEIKTQSSWPALLKFLGELQQPEQFIVIEKANLKRDSKDDTMMQGTFTIAKWFAPK